MAGESEAAAADDIAPAAATAAHNSRCWTAVVVETRAGQIAHSQQLSVSIFFSLLCSLHGVSLCGLLRPALPNAGPLLSHQ